MSFISSKISMSKFSWNAPPSDSLVNSNVKFLIDDSLLVWSKMEKNKLDRSMKDSLSVLEGVETKQHNDYYEKFQTAFGTANRKKKKVTAVVSKARDDPKGLSSFTNRLLSQSNFRRAPINEDVVEHTTHHHHVLKSITNDR